MKAAIVTKTKNKAVPKRDNTKIKPVKTAKAKKIAVARQMKPNVCQIVSDENGMLLNDLALEAEVVSFINEYRDKEITDLDKPAVVLSNLRALYNAYSAKIERSGGITKGVLTKYGIRRGMLLNIEQKLLEHNGQQWLEHYTREYGGKSLRTAQDYKKLAKTKNILQYAVIGKERLMKILRAIKILGIEGDDPIAKLFQECDISFDPEESYREDKIMELKVGIDNAIAKSRIRKAEEQKSIELGVNLDHINNLISAGVQISGCFINDLFELKSEGRDVNRHLESLCSDDEDGDELLPHIKKVSSFSTIVDRLKSTIESLNQNSGLVNRIELDQINDLERYIAELKNLYENQNSSE